MKWSAVPFTVGLNLMFCFCKFCTYCTYVFKMLLISESQNAFLYKTVFLANPVLWTHYFCLFQSHDDFKAFN